MNERELIRRMHEPLRPEALIPLATLQDDESRQRLGAEMHWDIPAWDELIAGVTHLGKPLDRFFVSKGTLDPYCYFDGLVLHDIGTLEVGYLDKLQVKERIEAQEKFFAECQEKGEYEKLLYTIKMGNPRATMYALEKLYHNIPDAQKYQVFRDIYVDQEYGLGALSDEVLRDALGRAPRLRSKHLPRPNKAGKVVIYRGITKESRPLDKAHSWTTSFALALWFATRYSREGEVLQAEVAPQRIIDYIRTRNEDEVLVLPEQVENVVQLPMVKMSELAKRPEFEQVISDYQRHANSDIILPASLFLNPKGIHGRAHTKRVLFHVLVLATMEKVSLWERQILIHAALYHDIARKNDDEDTEHGRHGFMKMKATGRCWLQDDQAVEILRYVIDNHCVGDALAFQNIRRYQIEQPERAIYLLKLLKDADGLDRVRLRDLDIKYLRTESGTQLPVVACQVLHGLKENN